MLVSLVVLVVATVQVWNHRYETVTNRMALEIRGADGGMIRIGKQAGEPVIIRSIQLPMGGDVSHLHLKFSHRAVDLAGGSENWQVGRLILDWRGADGRVVARDTVLSLEGNDGHARISEMVLRARDSGLKPSLRIEHLGRSGRMEIGGLQVMAVCQRPGFVWLASTLACGWCGWCFCWIGSACAAGTVRRLLAAGMMFVLGWFLAVPGPWAHPRPLGDGFAMGSEPARTNIIMMDPADNNTANPLEPLGEMPVQGSWLVKVKVVLSLLRPLLHLLLFAGPAFALAVCCGWRCAGWTMVLVSLAVETSQAAFWHGSDWMDGVDLMVDWAGIAMALLVYRRIAGWQRPGFIFRQLQGMMLPSAKSA